MRIVLRFSAVALVASLTYGSAASASLILAAPAGAQALAAGAGAPTQAFMDKMTRLIQTKGVDKVVPADYANALGLTPAGQGWADHQVGADATDKTSHAFAVSRGADLNLVLYARRSDGTFYVFRAGRDGKSLAALSIAPQTTKITVREAAAVQQELDDEFAFWARSVDKLQAGTP
jgi:hypothetical protein